MSLQLINGACNLLCRESIHYKARILRESEPLSDRIPTQCHIIQYVTFTLTYHSEFVYCIKQSKLKARNSVPIVRVVNGLVVTFKGNQRHDTFLYGVKRWNLGYGVKRLNLEFCVLLTRSTEGRYTVSNVIVIRFSSLSDE